MSSARATWALVATLLSAACSVSDSEERALGGEYVQQINAQLPLVPDTRVAGYVDALGKEIARKTSRGSLDWKFFVVDSRDVNAFAVPGGFVYVNRGLIERARSLDQLAGVLGHEIGHIVERHSVEQMKKATGANIGVTLPAPSPACARADSRRWSSTPRGRRSSPSTAGRPKWRRTRRRWST